MECSKSVVISKDISEMMNESSLNSIASTVIVIDDDFDINSSLEDLFTINTYILSSNSLEQFKTTLLKLKSLSWWNSDTRFFIFDVLRENSCKNASEILIIMWNMNFLSSLYVCYETGNELILYTYNPFTNRAPYPWKELESPNKPDERWTLYKQSCTKDEKICKNLFFDKTKFLDGYKINVVANTAAGKSYDPGRNYNINSILKKLSHYDGNIFYNIFRAINVTPIVYYDEPGYKVNNVPLGWLSKLINGTYDISLSGRIPGTDKDFEMLYPIYQFDFVILTQHRHFLSPYEKIHRFYGIPITIPSTIVLFITSIVIKFYKKTGFTSASLEIFRLIVNTSILSTFDRLSFKIFLSMTFLLIIILNATFQGNLASFLTKPQRESINTVRDLSKFKYHVYLHISDSGITDDWSDEQKQYLYFSDNHDCYENVFNDSSSACIGNPIRQLHHALEHDLHLSPPIAHFYITHWFRSDFPLATKIDDVKWKLMDAGFIHQWYTEAFKDPLTTLQAREAILLSAKYRPIKLKDLDFAFVLLAFGLLCSSVIFIIEMVIGRKYLSRLKFKNPERILRK